MVNRKKSLSRLKLVDEKISGASEDKQTPFLSAIPETKKYDLEKHVLIQGLSGAVNDLTSDLPPEILRGKYSSDAGREPRKALDRSAPPIVRIDEIFDDIAVKAQANGIEKFLDHIGSRPLKVATLCSGTESPLLALELLTDSFRRLLGKDLRIYHLFSAEIESFKQSYIQRNFSPDIIFRDVNELVSEEATTAFGSIRKVPTDPDLLVFGFSCVDFSNLNNRRKKLGEIGESSDTFFAIINYMKRCRPPLAVVENVSGAPWPKIIKIFEDIGYHGYFLKADTRTYYLPQTRERGYLFCVDSHKLPKFQETGKKSEFATLMKKFQRTASSPVTDFLLPQDDQRTKDAIDEFSSSRSGKERAARDWTRYKLRHMIYRSECNLGTKRPLTKWQDNGTCRMPDFFWHDWCRSQTERVWDTLDTNYLRTLRRGFDITFKTRIIDLSQGIDRELDRRALGVVGCLTPRGLHFISSRGGPLLGVEALALQGIPIDRLLLGSETQRNLYDLAGNAMSSTVVGPAILSALILGREALQPGPAASNVPVTTPDIPGYLEYAQAMITLPHDLLQTRTLSTAEIVDGARRSARLCLCEGPSLIKPSDLLRCSKCGHTACKRCRQRPSHAYEAISDEELRERIPPGEFQRHFKTRLPMRLQIDGLCLGLFIPPTGGTDDAEDAWISFREVLEPALGEELRFCGMTRGSMWTISYEGSRSVLKLACLKSTLRWSLYVLPCKNEPSNSPLRQILKQPVAWMVPPGDSLLDGTWHVRSPISSRFNIIVSGEGERMESHNSRVGLEKLDVRDTSVWSSLRVTADNDTATKLQCKIDGLYELHQDCGAASGSLHRRLSSDDSNPVYLFLDPTDLGPPEFDSWVFAQCHERLDIGQVRDTLAEVRPNWSAFRLEEEPQTMICWYRQSTECKDVLLKAYCASASATYRIPNFNDLPPSISMDCKDSYLPLLECSVPATANELALEKGVWNSSNLLDSSDMLKRFAWLLQRTVSITHFEEWRVFNFEGSDFNTDCRVCAPEKPHLIWALDTKGKLRPYEKPEEAALYEKGVKTRPPLFLGYTILDDNDKVNLHLCLNIPALLHRAIGKLLNHDKLSLQWRLCIDTAGFVRSQLPELRSRNNENNVGHSQPPRFNLKLRSEQLQSLSWMVSQESDDAPPFEEEEFVEALLPTINWRAEGRALTKRQVRGGILADDIGYGKSAISLALIDVQFEADSKTVPDSVDGAIPTNATLIIIPDHICEQWQQEINKFLGQKHRVVSLLTTASVARSTIRDVQTADIVVVSHAILNGLSYSQKMEMFAGASELPVLKCGRIFDEWLNDAMVGLREHVNLLVNHGSVAALNAISRKREALQNGEGVFKYRPSKRRKGKEFQEYVKLRREAAAKSDEGEDESDTQAEASSSSIFPQHSSQGTKRKNGSGRKGNGANERTQKKLRIDAAAKGPDSIFSLTQAKNDWTSVKNPLVHMFEFNRVIIDEFSYLPKTHIYASALAIPARKKWILSATPPLNDFAGVKTFAPLLGVNLGIDDEGDYRGDNERLKVEQAWKTDVEHFEPFATRNSAAWYERKHAIAQGFLDRFMRKNRPVIDQIHCTEHICEVVLSSPERVLYIELFMRAMNEDLSIRDQGRRVYDTNEFSRVDTMIDDSKTVVEALLKRSSLYCLIADEKGLRKHADKRGSVSTIEPRNGPHHLLDTKALFDIRANELKRLALDVVSHVKSGLYFRSSLERSKNAGKYLETLCETKDSQVSEVPSGIEEPLESEPLEGTEELQESNPLKRFDDILSQIETHMIGDQDAAKSMQILVSHAKKGFDADAYEKQLYPETSKRKPKSATALVSALKDSTDNLLRLMYETVTRTRAARRFQAIPCFQNPAPGAIFRCQVCLSKETAPEELHLLGECGHSVCSQCLEICKLHEACRYPSCDEAIQEHKIINCKDLRYDESTPINPEWRTYGSSKNAQLVDLLQDESKIPKDDQVLLFIQYPDMIREVSAILDFANITHQIGSHKNATELAKFARGEFKVLILTLGDVTAAGLNLQNANHTIFYSPLVAETQYDYDSGMAQAIGRCRRFGQKKHVHVHHMLALKTVEVSIFEQRRREQVIRRDGIFTAVPSNEVKSTDEHGWSDTSLEETVAKIEQEEDADED